MYTNMYFFILIVCLNTMTSMINTNVFFDFTDFQVGQQSSLAQTSAVRALCGERTLSLLADLQQSDGAHSTPPQTAATYVTSFFVVHVGGPRCVPSSTDHYMKIPARITFDCWLYPKPVFFYVCLRCECKDEYDQD